MSSKRSLPDWHEDTGFRPDMSLFDGPTDKIIEKIPRKPVTTPREAMAGIKGYSGLGATNEGPDDDDKYLDDLITEMNPDVDPPSMEKIVSDLPNYQPDISKQQKVQYAPKNIPVESLPKSSYVPRYGDDWHDRYNTPSTQGKGGASRKMRKSKKTKKSRRMRRVKSQMRRKNSSRKSTRRRQRK
jgi:hypothetical protein